MRGTVNIVSLISCFLWLLLIRPSYLCAGDLSQPLTIIPPLPMATDSKAPNEADIWDGEVGQGFRAGTQAISLNTGITYGVLLFGGDERHDLVQTTLSYGRMVGGIKGADQWYQGNLEVRVELLGEIQVNSDRDLTVGITPHLRYNFATSSCWVPYADVGVGIMLTEIRDPDLGSAFQFNEQAAAGVNYFLRDDFAINVEGRFFHISSAGISKPNKGINTAGAFMGANWFF